MVILRLLLVVLQWEVQNPEGRVLQLLQVVLQGDIREKASGRGSQGATGHSQDNAGGKCGGRGRDGGRESG